MSEESSFQGKLDDVDFENMKVTELKKKLKVFGLSPSGNKSELIERLQEAMISGKDISMSEALDVSTSDVIDISMSDAVVKDLCTSDSLDMSASDAVDMSASDAVETDLEASLLNDSGENISTQSVSDIVSLDDFASSPEKVALNEAVNKTVDSTTNSKTSAVPLKKRAFTRTQAPKEAVKVEKRIVLKRNNIPTPKFIPTKPVLPKERISVITEVKNKSVIDNKKDEVSDDKQSKIGISGTVIRLSGTNMKGLTEFERIQSRAKRFNIEPASRRGKLSEAVKNNLISTITSNTISTAQARKSDMDAKNERAFRFGFNVRNALKQLEQQELMSKRKCKFGTDSEVTDTEQEKKKKRAERFGLK